MISLGQGEIITAADANVRLLPEVNPGRKLKRGRYMVVVQANWWARDPRWPVVLACPIHSDHQATSEWDVEIPVGEVKALDALSFVVIPSIQPIRKADVTGQYGTLSAARLGEVYAKLAEYMGAFEFLDSHERPPF